MGGNFGRSAVWSEKELLVTQSDDLYFALNIYGSTVTNDRGGELCN